VYHLLHPRLAQSAENQDALHQAGEPLGVCKANYADEGPALQGLVQGLSRDLGPRGITINNVQPGPVDTDMNPAEGEFAEMLKKLMALPRYAHVDEIAAMVAYLAGPEAGFVTGASLMIDGGFAA
jgi:3-oxoacyl-[acyl-carrier protein] reductase